MSKRIVNSDNQGHLPSSVEPSKDKTKIEISKSVLIRVIIMIILLLFLLGCAYGNGGTKKVFCHGDGLVADGWISAENNRSYWVVDSYGKVMEFEKSDCSIKR